EKKEQEPEPKQGQVWQGQLECLGWDSELCQWGGIAAGTSMITESQLCSILGAVCWGRQQKFKGRIELGPRRRLDKRPVWVGGPEQIERGQGTPQSLDTTLDVQGCETPPPL
ncbi:hypothetical protein H1C71_035418, partial [Ictidomys tridecemlineatus]